MPRLSATFTASRAIIDFQLEEQVLMCTWIVFSLM